MHMRCSSFISDRFYVIFVFEFLIDISFLLSIFPLELQRYRKTDLDERVKLYFIHRPDLSAVYRNKDGHNYGLFSKLLKMIHLCDKDTKYFKFLV